MSISPMEVEGVNINSDDRGLKNNNTFRCGLHGRVPIYDLVYPDVYRRAYF